MDNKKKKKDDFHLDIPMIPENAWLFSSVYYDGDDDSARLKSYKNEKDDEE